jgi:tellurite methyltransferase
MRCSSFDDRYDERRRWNKKYLKHSHSNLKETPDLFLEWTFNQFIRPLFPNPGCGLDLAGGTGRHAIWLAQQGWTVTLIDISEVGSNEQAQNEETSPEAGFDLVMVFNFLERAIFPQIIQAIRTGGLLVYKTYKTSRSVSVKGPRDPKHLLQDGELMQLARGLKILHYREKEDSDRATAELAAKKD